MRNNNENKKSKWFARKPKTKTIHRKYENPLSQLVDIIFESVFSHSICD